MTPMTESEYIQAHKAENTKARIDELRSFLDSGEDYAELEAFNKDNPHADRVGYQSAARHLWQQENYFDARRLTITVRAGHIFCKIDKRKEVR